MRLSEFKIHLWWLIPLLILDVLFFAWWWKRYSSPLPTDSTPPPIGKIAVIKNIRIEFACPTDRTLNRFNPDNFQPTVSGRPESAFYGSVRIAREGKKLWPSFHEGVDIAAQVRDRSGYPRDAVMAAAAGEIAYLNRYSGNSNYGKYVVISHGAGPGRLYTLYAHLSSIAPGIRKGVVVEQGTILGVMGATSTDHIAPASGHLHFEVDLMLNARFDQWFKQQKLSPDHGLFNGWNLLGVDPLSVFERQEEDGRNEYDLNAHLAAIPPAFEIVLRTRRQIDFFRRYPALWQGADFNGDAMVIACSENGLPLSGRCAGSEETAALGRKTCAVGKVDPAALGRNGCRLVVNDKGAWRLGAEGRKWLNLLVY